MNTDTRIAGLEDAHLISQLGKVTFTETFGHLFRDRNDLLDYLHHTFSVDKIEVSLTKSSNIFWISFIERLPVAYAKLKLDSTNEFIASDKVCQLQKIYVLKDFLSLKIGSTLQDLLIEKAKSLGFKSIWLSVLDDNERAIKFYLKNKFTEIGTHDFQIGRENFSFKVLSKNI